MGSLEDAEAEGADHVRRFVAAAVGGVDGYEVRVRGVVGAIVVRDAGDDGVEVEARV